MRARPALSLVLSFASWSACAMPARAGGRDPAAAEVLFRDGRARMEAGDVAGACPKFAESLRLDYAPGSLLNLAACEERLGRLASAWQHYVQLSELLPPSDERRGYARERAATLERRLPRLTIRLTKRELGARVSRDDVELGSASLGEPLPVDPGEHRVVVDAPGRAAAQFFVTVREGERRVLDVAPAPPPPTNGQRNVGWVVGGAGVVSVATGAYFGVRAIDAPPGESSQSFARAADVTIGLGVVALVVAGCLLFYTPSDEAAPRAALRITPTGVGGTW